MIAEGIWIALITGICAVVGNWLIYRSNRGKEEQARKDEIAARAKEQQKLDDRLEQIEKKLDSHNGYAQRYISTSNTITAMQKDIEFLKDDVEFIKDRAILQMQKAD